VAFLGARGPLWYVERGWALLLGAWFVLVILAWPRASFVTRAVGATAATAASAAAVLLMGGGWSELDWTIASHYRDVAQAMGQVWPGGLSDAENVIRRAAELPARVFPALVSLGSVAALGVGWWGYRRLARGGEPLGRLREFRFPDALVWVLIGGLALVVLPAGGWTVRLGSNVVLFMSALYAVRGLAVMVAVVLGLVGSQVPVLIVLGLVGLILYPIVVAGTLLLGVTDTWLDLRSGRRKTNDEG
jgi:hypothetical protein